MKTNNALQLCIAIILFGFAQPAYSGFDPEEQCKRANERSNGSRVDGECTFPPDRDILARNLSPHTSPSGNLCFDVLVEWVGRQISGATGIKTNLCWSDICWQREVGSFNETIWKIEYDEYGIISITDIGVRSVSTDKLSGVGGCYIHHFPDLFHPDGCKTPKECIGTLGASR